VNSRENLVGGEAVTGSLLRRCLTDAFALALPGRPTPPVEHVEQVEPESRDEVPADRGAALTWRGPASPR
jgi:hypothetical protein